MRILEQCFRVYAESGRFEETIGFYEALQGTACSRRLTIAEAGVEVAKIGGVLLLAGDKSRLDAIRHVAAIFYVDSLDDFPSWLEANSGEIIHGTRAVTGGRNLTARHPDGLVAEYFEAAPHVPGAVR